MSEVFSLNIKTPQALEGEQKTKMINPSVGTFESVSETPSFIEILDGEMPGLHIVEESDISISEAEVVETAEEEVVPSSEEFKNDTKDFNKEPPHLIPEVARQSPIHATNPGPTFEDSPTPSIRSPDNASSIGSTLQAERRPGYENNLLVEKTSSNRLTESTDHGIDSSKKINTHGFSTVEGFFPSAREKRGHATINQTTQVPQSTIQNQAKTPSASQRTPLKEIDHILPNKTYDGNSVFTAQFSVNSAVSALQVSDFTQKFDKNIFQKIEGLEVFSPVLPKGHEQVSLGTKPPPTSAPVVQVAEKVSEILGHRTASGVDLLLHPKELGNIRISVISQEHGVLIQVSADKADTLEYLRRNSDALQAELLASGQSGAELQFGMASDDRSQENPTAKEESVTLSSATGADEQLTPRARTIEKNRGLPTNTLDLRL